MKNKLKSHIKKIQKKEAYKKNMDAVLNALGNDSAVMFIKMGENEWGGVLNGYAVRMSAALASSVDPEGFKLGMVTLTNKDAIKGLYASIERLKAQEKMINET